MRSDDVCSSQPSESEEPPMVEAIRTRQLEICDAEGRCAIRLGVHPDGAPFACFYDASGQERLSLALGRNFHPSVGMFASDGKPTIGLGVNDEMGTGINIFDSTHLRIFAGVLPDGRVFLKTLADGDGFGDPRKPTATK